MICPKCNSIHYDQYVNRYYDELRLCRDCGYKQGGLRDWIIDYIDITMDELNNKLKEEYKI